jgi:hypothetical protein
MECREQRGESRHTSRQQATYLTSLVTDATTITFEEGPVTILDESVHGALLQTLRPFYKGDIIEVHWQNEQPSAKLFDVRWCQPSEQWAESHDYLIGCHRILGPC